MYTCAICGCNSGIFVVCSRCKKQYDLSQPWAKEMIKMQRHFDRCMSNAEVPFVDIGKNLYGEDENSD